MIMRNKDLSRQEEYHVTFTSPIHSTTLRYRGRLFSTWLPVPAHRSAFLHAGVGLHKLESHITVEIKSGSIMLSTLDNLIL